MRTAPAREAQPVRRRLHARLLASRCRCAAAAAAAVPAPPPAAVRFRPCIDIHAGRVKQIVGSTLADAVGGSAAERPVTNFETDVSAAVFAARYRADGLTGGHVILLSQDAASVAAARAALAAHPGGLHLGGGVTAASAPGWLDAGASHVIVTSYVFREGRLDEERLRELVSAVGRDRLVLDLSCRRVGADYVVHTDRWQRATGLAVCGATLGALAASCAEFLVHCVDAEGKRAGVDAHLVALLGAHSPLPAVYAGGAASLADLDAVEAAGGGRVDVTVGSALDLFGGGLRYDDVVAWHNARRGARGG